MSDGLTSQLPAHRFLPRVLVIVGVALIFISAAAWFPASLGFVFYVFWAPFVVGQVFPNLGSGPWLFRACWAIEVVALICAWVWALRAWDLLSVSYGVAFVSAVLTLLGLYSFV